MKKEYKRHFKSAVLIFLILLSFVLVFRLWSIGNYFGTGLSDTFKGVVNFVKEPLTTLFNKNESVQNLKFVLSPKRIVVNFSDVRSIMYNDEDDFWSIYDEVINILKNIESGKIKIKSVETVKPEDYYASLKTKSVLIDYDSKYDYNLLAILTEAEEDQKLMEGDAVVREFIISMPDNVLEYSYFYIMDYRDNKVYRYLLDMNKSKLQNLVYKRLSKNVAPDTYNYSFELNFHTGENIDGTPAKVVFNPLTSVALVPEERVGIISHRYGSTGEVLENESEILKKFNINEMSAGKYTDIDGSRNFVEKNAALKIGSEGFIEYTAQEGGGINLKTEGSKSDIGTAATVTTDFVTQIFNLLPQSPNCSLRITSDLTESKTQGSYTILYDYYIGGLPVFQTEKEGKVVNSVVAEVENGKLIYYKHYIRAYDFLEEKKIQETMITAADVLVSKLLSDGEQLKISKAYECFIDMGTSSPEADWVFEIDGLSGLYR